MKKILGLALGLTMIAFMPVVGSWEASAGKFDKFENSNTFQMKCFGKDLKQNLYVAKGKRLYLNGNSVFSKKGRSFKQGVVKKPGEPVWIVTFEFNGSVQETYINFKKKKVIEETNGIPEEIQCM